MSKDILSESGKEGVRVLSAPGSRPSDQAPAGLAASRVDPSRVRNWLVAMGKQGEDQVWRGAQRALECFDERDALIRDAWGALNFILAFYEPGQRYLDTEAWKVAEAGGRQVHARLAQAMSAGTAETQQAAQGEARQRGGEAMRHPLKSQTQEPQNERS